MRSASAGDASGTLGGVQTVHLTWQHSGEFAVVLAAAGGGMALSTRRAVRSVGAWARETAVIAVLWGLWQLAGEVSLTSAAGAYSKARWIEVFERDLWLPSERGAQHLILGHRLVVEAANLYYAMMHLTTMFVFLAWLFLRHRAAYPRVRAVMAGTTLGCLIIQLLPVAPPRMLKGFVDTGLVYNQSVYSNGLPIDQLSAMPSMHVAWAFLIGYYVWRISPSRGRWLGPAHAVVTTFVVVATGNHWWLDGIVAAGLLCACAWLNAGVRAAFARRSQLTIPEQRELAGVNSA